MSSNVLAPSKSFPKTFPAIPRPPQIQQFAHIGTPIVPRDTDDFFLSILLHTGSFNAPCGTQHVTINTLITPTCITTHIMSPLELQIVFGGLPIRVRDTWNRFIEEMHERPELKDKVIVTKQIEVDRVNNVNGYMFRIVAVDRPY